MKRLLIIFALVLLLPGCSIDGTGAKNAVLKYNELLAEGYRNLNMNPLATVSTIEIASKAYNHMAALGEARVKMDSKMDNIKFLTVKPFSTMAGDRIEVKTEEDWKYKYINLDSGKSSAESSVSYQMKYILEKRSGRWLVSDITILKEEGDKSAEDIFERPMGQNDLKTEEKD
ncbi:MAG: hypothetical protein AB1632_09785 [Nitrospirota bacterium]